MDEITITKEKFTEKAADATFNFLKEANIETSAKPAFIMFLAIYANELKKLLFENEVQ